MIQAQLMAAAAIAVPALILITPQHDLAHAARAVKPKPSPLSTDERRCLQRTDRARIVTFRAADRRKLVGVVTGSGSTVVVLGHQYHSTICEWMPYARQFARAGFRALVFNFRNNALSAIAHQPARSRVDLDMAAAANYIGAKGARRVVLVGSSMGGTGALVAAATLTPWVAGVIALSPPKSFGPADAVAAGQQLRVPVLLVAAEDDEGFIEEARVVFDAIASSDKRLQVVPGTEHGTYMLRGKLGAPLRRTLVEYIRERAALR